MTFSSCSGVEPKRSLDNYARYRLVNLYLMYEVEVIDRVPYMRHGSDSRIEWIETMN